MDLDNQYLTGLIGSITSTGLLIVGLVTSYIPLIPIGAIVLATSLSFFFQAINQKSNRKYEKGRLAVTEVLGPLHGDLLSIEEAFASAKTNKQLFYHSSTVWEEIVHSHKSFLIDEKLKDELLIFYRGLSDLARSGIANNIRDVVYSVIEPFLGLKLASLPIFRVKLEHGTAGADFNGLVFWRIGPTEQVRGTLESIVFEAKNPKNSEENRIINERNELIQFTDRYLPAIWNASDKEPKIVEARRSHERLHSEVIHLKGIVEKEIKEWAK